jgi:hypothetical protein
MTAATDTDLQQVKDLITSGNAAIQKQIADLAIQVAELGGDLRETKAKLEGDIKALDTKFEEKTKNLDQRITGKEFTTRGITVTILGGLLLAFGKFLFFGKI